MSLESLLVGLDIGLVVYLAYLYWRIRGLAKRRMTPAFMLRAASQGPGRRLVAVVVVEGRVLGAARRGRLAPLSSLLEKQFKYLAVFLVIYSIVLALYLLHH